MSGAPETFTSFADSLRRLKTAQKSSRGAPFYSLVVNRPLGRLLAALAHRAGMTPNQVTVVSAFCTLTGIGLLASLRPSWMTALLVGAALVLGYALDAADGQLARLRGGGSLAGEWLDHVIDSFKIATLHLAVLVTAYLHFAVPRWWLFVPLVYAAAYVIHFFGMLLTDLLTRISVLRGAVVTEGSPSWLMSVLKLPMDYGTLCLSFLLLGMPRAFVVVYTALTIGVVGYTALVLPKWYGRIRALG